MKKIVFNILVLLIGISFTFQVDARQSIFNDYKNWNVSLNVPTDMTYKMLEFINSSRGPTFVDVNWDWLVDVLYNYNYYMTALLNEWDLGYKIWYICYAPLEYVQENWRNIQKRHYYGDCAQ